MIEKLLRLKLRSGNSVPVDRVTLTAAEASAAADEIERLRGVEEVADQMAHALTLCAPLIAEDVMVTRAALKAYASLQSSTEAADVGK